MPVAGEMPLFIGDIVIPGTGGATTIPTVKGREGTLLGQITWLAYWLETRKTPFKLVGPLTPLFGGPLLADLSSRIDVAGTAFRVTSDGPSLYASSTSYQRLVVISSHYNVQLGILSALNVDTYLSTTSQTIAVCVPWITIPSMNIQYVTGSVPAAAAVLAFELRESIKTLDSDLSTSMQYVWYFKMALESPLVVPTITLSFHCLALHPLRKPW